MTGKRRQWVIFDGRQFFSGKTLADHIAGLAGMDTERVSWQIQRDKRTYILRVGGEVVLEYDFDPVTRTVKRRNSE